MIRRARTGIPALLRGWEEDQILNRKGRYRMALREREKRGEWWREVRRGGRENSA